MKPKQVHDPAKEIRRLKAALRKSEESCRLKADANYFLREGRENLGRKVESLEQQRDEFMKIATDQRMEIERLGRGLTATRGERDTVLTQRDEFRKIATEYQTEIERLTSELATTRTRAHDLANQVQAPYANGRPRPSIR